VPSSLAIVNQVFLDALDLIHDSLPLNVALLSPLTIMLFVFLTLIWGHVDTLFNMHKRNVDDYVESLGNIRGYV